jgi:hypothetical protein
LDSTKRRLKTSEVVVAKASILRQQECKCPLCQKTMVLSEACQDHDHRTGLLRGVLCRNCNGIEGKVANLANRAKRDLAPEMWLGYLIKYWLKHKTDQTGLYHPVHKTADEKRLLTNARARAKRAAKRKVS